MVIVKYIVILDFLDIAQPRLQLASSGHGGIYHLTPERERRREGRGCLGGLISSERIQVISYHKCCHSKTHKEVPSMKKKDPAGYCF